MNYLVTKLPDKNKSDVILTNFHPDKEAEIELWNAYRSGSRQALNTIFEKYVRGLYSYSMNMTRNQQLISDCIQDLFVELWVKREMVTARVNSIKYYLIRSVRRRILRRLSADRRFEGQFIPENYSEEVEFHIEFYLIQEQSTMELSRQLKDSIATLSKRQQEAIYLKFYENMTYEEIASLMNTNVKAVYNLVGKSIVSLKRFFETHPIGY